MYDDRYYTLDHTLENAKLQKFEWGKYTVYAMDHKPATYWYGVKLTEKIFVDDPKGGLPLITEVEILPEQIPPMDWAYFLQALRGEKYWGKDWFWDEQRREESLRKTHEKEAQRLTEKADIMRRALGADVVAIDEMPISHSHPEAYESWMKGITQFCEFSNRLLTEEEAENLKKRIPWLYKMFYGDVPINDKLAKLAGVM